ncbi:putative serine/threonine-protein kinase roco8 [Cytospora mali]|uniref:Serine/threonine-protein kinase roco8 n=1 Tax=Cytospora mali TaxID=578113 RepID=A0A194UNF4_CYTMA|nr:putative serine/threonine-protein kinase roco8 [Valsa mali var. pyri (nom. inval.)]
MASQTTMKYAHLFVDGDDQYLFVKILGNGDQSYAQLMWHLQSGKLRVRKERARKTSVQPNIVHMFSGGDVPARQQNPEDPQKRHRVAWVSYMNGGHLDDFRAGCSERGLVVPRPIILRLVHQIASALQFMYAQPAVLHRDLNSANILLSWAPGDGELPDFYISDFGRAVQADEEGFGLLDVHAQRNFEEGFQPYEEDVQFLLKHVRALLACPSGRAKKGGEGEPDIVRQVVAKLKEAANPPLASGSPPGLTGLLDLVSNVPALPNDLQDLAEFKFGLQDAEGTTPLYHDTLDECLQAKQIHGPWYCAKVSLSGDPAKVLPVILEISDRTHHRPNKLNDDSETDSEDLPGMIKVFD